MNEFDSLAVDAHSSGLEARRCYGVIVCIGVLLDTLLVRSVLVPALVFLLGDRFWWPGRIRRSPMADSPAERMPETLMS